MQRFLRIRKTIWVAWFFCAVVCAWSLFAAVNTLAARAPDARPLRLAADIAGALVPMLFVIPATLVIARQPRNTIGWLMMVPAIASGLSDAATRFLATYPSAPAPVTIPILVLAWYISSAWLPAIFPLLLFPLLFPTGRLISPGWRWVVLLAGGMCLFFLIFAALVRVYQLDFVPWSLANPIGFLSDQDFQVIIPVWSALLLVVTVASLASFFTRYRRASSVEREQMKWLLYACSIFGFVYIFGILINSSQPPPAQVWFDLFDLLLSLAVIAIPAAVAIAILRYRLFEIDVIIRLTLTYALVTGLLALAFTGGVIFLQAVFLKLTGQTSDLAIVMITLAIATLFNPLRLSIQAAIDRRFYRHKYNAEQALAQFAASARSSSDLDVLTAMMEDVIQKNLQPTQVSVQLKPQGEHRKF